jgi:hypothetical protein
VGIQRIFSLEDDIRVIAQADSLAGLHHAIQRFPTDVILLELALYCLQDQNRAVIDLHRGNQFGKP